MKIRTICHNQLLFLCVIGLFFHNAFTYAEDTTEWMPDPALRQAVREQLELPADEPLTKDKMLLLTRQDANHKGIIDITGLEFATNITILHLGGRNRITDLTPLANLINLVQLHVWNTHNSRDTYPIMDLDINPLAGLINLERLSLSGNGITDISPLAGLKKLRVLDLTHNHIVDFTPLAGLTSLEELKIKHNWATDFSPLSALNLTTFEYDEDEVCELPPISPPVAERIQNRTLPSIVGLWPKGSIEDIVQYDFHYGPHFYVWWDTTPTEPTLGLSTRFAGDVERSKEIVQQMLQHNPNMVFVVPVRIHNRIWLSDLPADSDFWLRDGEGNIIQNANDAYMTNILNPELQDHLIDRIVAVAKCGLFDGIMLDGFNHHGLSGAGGGRRPLAPELADDEAIIQAHIRILRGVRERVRDDFLILINANHTKATRYAEYVNGSVMEPGEDYIGHGGGTYRRLQELDDALLWNEKNLRAPRLNWASGFLFPDQPPDTPDNLQRVRLFTTRGLTLADNAYTVVNYVQRTWETWADGNNFWYDFWDADIGKPIGEKGQLCDNCEGLFIREFTNGWVVYNRSGKAQTIELPIQATGVASGITNIQHTVPDLDGEMYLKQEASTDSVGTVKVLDLSTEDPQAASEWMPDPALRAAIIEQLGLPANIPLTKDKMPRLTQRLIAPNKGIVDITGLEFATNLKALNLGKNHITDLRPLANLTNLLTLYIWDVSKQGTDSATSLDISPLAGLIHLEELSLERNGISDITPLESLKNLRVLHLTRNHIEDFSPLTGLTNLETLWINNNPATDFSPLAALNLTDLRYDADVNGDGETNILDLVAVANAFGKAEPDLNGDGVVNIQDLVIVANAL